MRTCTRFTVLTIVFLLLTTCGMQAQTKFDVPVAGSLPEIIGSKKDTLTSLTLTGTLNGTDINCIRQMQKLELLDLAQVKIVKGGDAYAWDTMGNEIHTENDQIGNFMFAKDNRTFGSEEESWLAPLHTLILPKGATAIGDNAFAYRKELVNLILPEKLTTIYWAFDYCQSLATLHFPASLKTLYADFSSCSSLKSFSVEADSQSFSAENGILFNKNKTELIHYPPAKNENSYQLPSYVETIKSNAFCNATNLSSITLTENLKIISSGSFSRSGLTSIRIPASVKEIGDAAFYNCPNLSSIIVGGTNAYYKANGNVLFTKDGSKLILYPMNLKNEWFDVPQGVKTINDNAFYHNLFLKDISLPIGVLYIKEYAFSRCSSLETVSMPSTIIEINDYAFYKCANLKSITIPPNVTDLKYGTFNGCKSLVEIHNLCPTPQSAPSFEDVNQSNCTLYVPIGAKIHYESAYTWRDFKKIIEESSVIVEEGRATVTLPTPGSLPTLLRGKEHLISRLELIGAINGDDIKFLRYLCNQKQLSVLNLQKATITNGGDSYDGFNRTKDQVIGEKMFAGLNKLTTLSLPTNTSSIEAQAFSYSAAMTTLSCLINIPPAATASSFEGTNKGCRLTVPETTQGSYSVATGWNFFSGKMDKSTFLSDQKASIYMPQASLLRSILGEYINTLKYLKINGPINGTDVVCIRGMESLVEIDMSEATIVEGGDSYVCGFGPPTEYQVYIKNNTIPEWMFMGMTNLETVTFPKSVTTIEGYVFSFANPQKIFFSERVTEISVEVVTNANTVYCYAKNPPVLESSSYEHPISGTLFVPIGCRDKYLADKSWGRFAKIIELNYNYLSAPGTLKETINIPLSSVKNLCLFGEINGTDIQTIRQMTSLQTLDLRNATIVKGGNPYFNVYTVNEEGAIPTHMLSGMSTIDTLYLPQNCFAIREAAFKNCTKLTHIVLPEEINIIEKESIINSAIKTLTIPASAINIAETAFPLNKSLLSVDWKSPIAIPKHAFEGGAAAVNPNCLYYLYGKTSGENAQSNNLIRDGVIDELILKEGNYEAVQPFRVHKISYSMKVILNTKEGTAAGWHTIALPFTAEQYVHSTLGELVPMNNEMAPTNNEVDPAKPFWLRQLTPDGFKDTQLMKANHPYIIAIPNEKSENTTGILTFSAAHQEGISIPATPKQLPVSEGREYVLAPTFSYIQPHDSMYALSTSVYENHPAGSVFVKKLRTVNPFEAYLISKETLTNAPRTYNIGDNGGNITDLFGSTVQKDDSFKSYAIRDILYIESDKARTTRIYGTDGRIVRTIHVNEGKNEITGLATGTYFLEGKKHSRNVIFISNTF